MPKFAKICSDFICAYEKKQLAVGAPSETP